MTIHYLCKIPVIHTINPSLANRFQMILHYIKTHFPLAQSQRNRCKLIEKICKGQKKNSWLISLQTYSLTKSSHFANYRLHLSLIVFMCIKKQLKKIILNARYPHPTQHISSSICFFLYGDHKISSFNFYHFYV